MKSADKKHTTLEFFRFFTKNSSKTTLLALFGLFVSGVFEGIGVAMLLPVLGGFMGGAQANALSAAVDKFFAVLSLPNVLGWQLGLFAGFIVLKAVVGFFSVYEVGINSTRVVESLRMRLSRALVSARWSYHVRLPGGRAGSALSQEAERSGFAYFIMCTILADAILVAIYIVLALMVSWQVCVAAMLAGATMLLVLRGIIDHSRRIGKEQATSLRAVMHRISDSLSSMKSIKAMGREAHYHGLISHEIGILKGIQRRQYFLRELMRQVREPILVAFLCAGFYAVTMFYPIEMASLMLLGVIFIRIVMKMTQLPVTYQQLVESQAFFWMLYDTIEEAEQARENNDGTLPPTLDTALEFKNVSFVHDSGMEEKVIDGLSVRFAARQLHALIGPSGAGKTTLVDLMVGFYQPCGGKILLDGMDLKDVNIKQWRSRIGYVPQDCILFNDSVWSNLTLGDETVSEKDVEEALKNAGAYEFVQALPMGIHENVGEKGQRLSGGQRQRIAIARALVKKPLLLLLDEPTSALDKGTEAALMTTLQRIAKHITVIMISHSEEVRGYVDHIYKMEQGRLISAENKRNVKCA